MNRNRSETKHCQPSNPNFQVGLFAFVLDLSAGAGEEDFVIPL